MAQRKLQLTWNGFYTRYNLQKEEGRPEPSLSSSPSRLQGTRADSLQPSGPHCSHGRFLPTWTRLVRTRRDSGMRQRLYLHRPKKDWQTPFQSSPHSTGQVAGRSVSPDVPRLLNPTQRKHKMERKCGVRDITAELREGTVSHGSSCTTWCNQLYNPV